MSAGTTYYRPSQQHRRHLTVANSEFITTVGRAITTEEARAFIQSVREEMPDANHHVYAFRAGYGNSVTEGMSDDGEPFGTSGPPTLAVLRGADIGDIVLVTTRYFGGTKLGTGGLVRAYTQSAQQALSDLPLELKAPRLLVGLDVSYSLYEQVHRLIKAQGGDIEEETFAGDVAILFDILRDDLPPLAEALRELSAGQIQPLIMEER